MILIIIDVRCEMAVKINPTSIKVSVKVSWISVNATLGELAVRDRMKGVHILNYRTLEADQHAAASYGYCHWIEAVRTGSGRASPG